MGAPEERTSLGKRFLRRHWRLGVSALALVLVLRYAGVTEFRAILLETNGLALLLFASGLALLPPIIGLQLWVTCKIAGFHIPVNRAVVASIHAWSVGTVTPARTGDLSLAWLLRDSGKGPDIAAIVVADKLLSVLALATLAAASAAWLTMAHTPTLITLVVAFAAAPVAAIILGKKLYQKERERSDAEVRWLTTGYRALLRIGTKPRLLAWIFGAAATRWIYITGLNVILFAALNQAPDFGTVLAATAIGRLVAIIPISIGGLGVKEPVQIPLYAAAGVTAAAVVAASILGMLCNLVLAALYPIITKTTRGACSV